jgi:hypothetical protein
MLPSPHKFALSNFESSREMGFGLAAERSREGRPSEISEEH